MLSVSDINPQILEGIWKKWYALNIHTCSSFMNADWQYENIYTKVGWYLHNIKYNYKKDKIPELAKMIADFIQGEYKDLTNNEYPFPQLDGMICVPPSKTRPFQPVIEIAKEVNKYIDIPILEGYLVKDKETRTMKWLSQEESQILLKDAFQAHNINDLKNKNILIFDDLYWTWTTLTEITRTLQKNGKIKNIFVLTITKTRTQSGMRNDRDSNKNEVDMNDLILSI